MSALLFAALRRLADGRFHSGEAVAKALGRTRASLSEALKRAPEMGIEVFSVPGKGYRLAMPIEFLDRAAVMPPSLKTRCRETAAPSQVRMPLRRSRASVLRVFRTCWFTSSQQSDSRSVPPRCGRAGHGPPDTARIDGLGMHDAYQMKRPRG